MNPSRIFIERPVATTLLMVALMLLGLVSYRYLPLAALPTVDYPTIQVQTFYPGASPDVMASAITAPLEKQFGQMASLRQMSSQSAGGASVITLQFDLSLALDVAEQEVQAAINAADSLLPDDLPAPPIYAKINPADTAILTLALTSRTMALTGLRSLAENQLSQKISQVAGVGLVSIAGGNRPAVRVRFDPRKLAAYGVAIDDLRTQISNLNVNTAKGSLDGPQRSWTIDSNDQIQSAGDYMGSVIAYENNRPVYLSNVASVVEGPEDTDLDAWMNRTPAILLNIQRQPGANVIKVVAAIKALLPGLEASLPRAAVITPLIDRTMTIRASVNDVELELALAVGLVVLVIFVFLRDLRATLIPSLSVPLSLVGALAAMYFWGFSLDNLSLMALTIAAGFVVDDAIVVIENITRYVESGVPPMQAALRGASEIAFTIIALTVSLLAVLIPLLFMADVVGRLFHEFAITLAATIVISAVVSLTLVPMLCGRLLRPPQVRHPGRLNRGAEAAFAKLVAAYARLLDTVLAHRLPTLLVAIGTCALTLYLVFTAPTGFFPTQDVGILQGVTTGPASISHEAMADRQQRVAAIVLADPDVISLSSYIGVDGTNPTLSDGRMTINLRPKAQRGALTTTLARLQRSTAAVPGIQLTLQPVQDLTIDTIASPGRYQLMVQSTDIALLSLWAPRLLDRLRRLPELSDVNSDQQPDGLALYLTIDRTTAGRFGITPATVDNALYDAFGQRIISTIFTQSNQYRVIMEADPTISRNVTALDSIFLPSSTASSGEVPLSSLVHVEERQTALAISHLAQFPAATISFNLAEGVALSSGIAAIEAARGVLHLPESVQVSYQGTAAAYRSSLSNELALVLAAVVAMYIVLGVLYESFIHPLTILSTLPSAGVGALLALRLAGADLDIIGVIGIVLLIGIVKKNAIMMIDFALSGEREAGLSPADAIRRACLLRFRPILMTTCATLFAALPLMLGSGTGSELRRPLGLAIVGGLLVSQMLTLFTTPVIYLAFDELGRRVRERGRSPRAAEGSAT
ncbi:efflux RND transporter permease subunit [Acidisoma cladoniae]|jgi:multidrug efflux pump|uniref:efflux RND transporter permease subunit n=1 Tax=Acidisoma cladoniae TaxID=3040935 RepID=UPI002550C8D5|nr:efflux RND transporter permease subunit [Acidisoma sp. PAMC 29798]